MYKIRAITNYYKIIKQENENDINKNIILKSNNVNDDKIKIIY